MSGQGGTRAYSRRRTIAVVLAALFVISAFTVLSMNSNAATLTVRVTISEIQGIDWVDDSPNYPDFYWKVTLGASTVATSDPYSQNLNHIYPNWNAYFYGLNAGGGQSYTLVIELWDDDTPSSADDICDISRYSGGGNDYPARSSQATMTYYIDTSTWTGDDGFVGDSNGVGHVSGNEDGSTSVDQDDCELWFTAVTIPNSIPTATIGSISPNPATVGDVISYSGYGYDSDGSIVGYNWRTSTVTLSTAASFTKQQIAEGTFTIYFKVLDDDGDWSPEVSRTLTVLANARPTATISSISPNPAIAGSTVTLSGYGTDPDGDQITEYSWYVYKNGMPSYIGNAAVSTVSTLPVGINTIYFKVMDQHYAWSYEPDTATVEITPNTAGVFHTDYNENTPTYKQGMSAVATVADSVYSPGSAVKACIYVLFQDSTRIELGILKGWYTDGAGQLVEWKSPVFYMELYLYVGTVGDPYERIWMQFGTAKIGTSHTLKIVKTSPFLQPNNVWHWGVYIDGRLKYGPIPIQKISVLDGNALAYVVLGECYNSLDKTVGRFSFTSLQECVYVVKGKGYGLKWYTFDSGPDIVHEDPPWDSARETSLTGPWNWFQCWIP